MIRRIFFMLAGTFVVLAACQSLPYRDDTGFLVSAQAESPEFPVYINGRLCTDTEGEVGLCAKRIRSTENIVFRFDPQTYPWSMTVNCTSGVKPVPGASVPAGMGYSFTIKADDFKQFVSFTCVGEVSPQDRDPPVSAKWHVRFVVIDSEYVQREAAYISRTRKGNFLVLGQYARSAWVFDDGIWRQHSQKTVVPVSGDPDEVKAYSQSFVMRFNYLNIQPGEQGVEP